MDRRPVTTEPRRRLPVVAPLAVGAFATGTDSFVIAGVLPAVADDLATSTQLVGLTVAVFAVAYALGGPPLVAATAGRRPRTVLLGAMAVFVVGNLTAAAATTVAMLGAARVVAALGAGVFVPVAIATAMAHGGPARRGRASAAVVGGASLAVVAGAPLGTLLAEASSWRVAFLAVAGVGVVAAVGVALLVDETPAPAAPSVSARLGVARDSRVVAVLAVTVLLNAAAFSLYPYLGAVFDTDGTGVALLVFAFGAGAVVGTRVGGVAADTLGARRTLLVAVVVSVAAFLALGWAGDGGNVGLGAVCAVVWGLAGWAVVPAQQARLVAMTGPSAPVALSLNSSSIHLGTGVGAGVGSAVIAISGPGHLWVAAVLVTLAALGVLTLRPEPAVAEVGR